MKLPNVAGAFRRPWLKQFVSDQAAVVSSYPCVIGGRRWMGDKVDPFWSLGCGVCVRASDLHIAN
eukprot:1625397-Amphidinium_carterae.1